MITRPILPQADVDELAKFIYDTQSKMAAFYVASWAKAHPKGKARSRHLARKLLTQMPAILKRYAKEAS